MKSTFDRLSATLVKNYQIAPEAVSINTGFASLNMDSLDVAELLFDIEDEFKVTFPAEPEQLPTVGDVVRYIDRLVIAQGASDERMDVGALPALQTS
ncbi:hypothetical protein GCM10027046_04500 [Uliginosibacterium flavum]|uniref:Phosphopantetheine-binding protein n=1 Tax=Uliginosibacterium flavum TaxID=1396831 RepID=A0ABV2TLE3_9RHOO